MVNITFFIMYNKVNIIDLIFWLKAYQFMNSFIEFDKIYLEKSESALIN